MKDCTITKSVAVALIIISALFLVAGCQSIADIKSPDHVGKTVAVSGTVQEVIKLGELSGYTLKDSAGDTIAVSSEILPKEGSRMTVNGVLMKDTIFGYYIKVN